MVKLIITLVAAAAAFASVLAFAIPLLERNRLTSRLKAVAQRRGDLSRAQRAQLKGGRKAPSRMNVMRSVVERLNLQSLLDARSVKMRLAMAGWRDRSAPLTYLFARIALPVLLFALGLAYTSTIFAALPLPTRLAILAGAAGLGFILPSLFVTNAIQKRQHAIKRAFPDALDLMVICVDAGLSVEAAMSRMVLEMGETAPELAEEFGLTGAELAFLADRKIAWSNLSERTGLAQIRSLATTLLQTEKYGTPVSQALRVLAQENRDSRVSEAEKKAAALPAKLTVPMIVFFMPVLFMVIIGPAVIQIMAVTR